MVLSDVTGPVDRNTGQLACFDLIDTNGLVVNQAPPAFQYPNASTVSSVVADLQVNRTGASNSQIDKNAVDRSNVVVRAETFMRNRLIQ